MIMYFYDSIDCFICASITIGIFIGGLFLIDACLVKLREHRERIKENKGEIDGTE